VGRVKCKSVAQPNPALWERQQIRIKIMNLQEYFKEEPKGSINEMAVFLGVTPTWM